MLDRYTRPRIEPLLARLAGLLERWRVTPDALTLAGLAVALAAAWAIATSRFDLGLALLATNRLLDGLDGALARRRGTTAFGGYLDAICDFAFYAAIPLAFALADPARNALPAAALLAAFLATSTSFLAFAAIAATQRAARSSEGKAFVYSSGLAEGTETIAIFVAMCLWPRAFPWLAWAFCVLCVLTIAGRVALARRQFRS